MADLDGKELAERIVAIAKKDRKLAQKLHELQALDSMFSNIFISGDEVDAALSIHEQTMPRGAKLRSEVAFAVAKPGDDLQEIEVWLSYYVKRVVAKLDGDHYPD